MHPADPVLSPLWVLPFAAVEGSLPWILFSGLAPLSYLSLRAPDGRCPLWVLGLEWGLPAALALVLHFRQRWTQQG